MSPATVWTELVGVQTGWSQAFAAIGGDPNDYFIDILFEGSVFFNPHVPWTQMSGSVTSGTELTTPSTTWTEIVI